MKIKLLSACGLGLLLVIGATAQSAPAPSPLAIPIEEFPKPLLWWLYHFRPPATGGVGPYHWRLYSGQLPPGLKLTEDGEISGTPQETGQFDFILQVTDSNSPPNQVQKKFTLSLEPALTVEWSRKATVNGLRIDGSIKVSNHTGRDFDLTMVVLAVNEIGRATAIGYQRFPLKENTRDLEIPFGDSLSTGNYQVNVDVVAEEPVSNRIFRSRLVTKQSVTQGP
jgi:hypothetical protein